MPYEGEFAQYKPLQRLVESERVKKLLSSYKVRNKEDCLSAIQILQPIKVQAGDWIPNWIISIDGSHAEVDIRNGFPGAEASYVTVASVLLDVAKMQELDQQRPVNPKEFKKIEEAESIDCALPGCNVIYDGEKSAKDSLRRSVFEVFSSVRMWSDGESLLDTYEALLKYKPTTERSQQCPYDENCAENRDYLRDNGRYNCSCELALPLYSTDALRIHERMNLEGTNGAIFSEIMQVWERVWMVHILRTLEARKLLSILPRLAIVLDGSLAVFGQPAWISQAIYKEVSRINTVAKQAKGGKDILLIGVEKTGTFVEHFENLDRRENGSLGFFPCQSVGLLTDSYIKQNIIFSDSTRPYGAATYFGRKFFYKTKSGARIVATLPFLADDHRDLTRTEISQYPRLSDAVGLLDKLVSSRFPNALVPLVSANAEAAIPLRLGNKVLENLAKELMAAN